MWVHTHVYNVYNGVELVEVTFYQNQSAYNVRSTMFIYKDIILCKKATFKKNDIITF